MSEKQIEKRYCYRCRAEREYEIVSGDNGVIAWESSHVEARGSSHVEAWESSHVVAWESSHVVARESSHVEAWGSSHVVARGSSHVEARGSSHVVARESSHVVARESSHVEARGSSHVEARGSSHVEGQSAMVAILLRSDRVKGKGGRRIEMFMQPTEVLEWIKIANAVLLDKKRVLLYKRTGSDFGTRNGIKYIPGTHTEAPDWDTERECGGGLHLCPHPKQCDSFRSNDGDRYVACAVLLEDVLIHAVPEYPDKVKVRACENLYECDSEGNQIEVANANQSSQPR